MGIMAIGRIIILSALIAQALSAPSGCIETCDFLQTSIKQTLGSYQDHANLVQGTTHLNDHAYVRPGNWTEHNQYNTDSGHGKVHEERGQYVEGSKRVRYYKKNFTSSYGTDNVHGVNAAELGELSGQHRYDSLHVPSNQHLDSQSAYDLGQTVTKETGYNRVHSQQTQSTRIGSKSERLEDFGEYDGYSQVNQHVPSINTHAIDTQHHIETVPNNWSKADSYRTDGGHGQVFEEEGQYVTGPKKVRYYKKNYTSSYSSGVPQSSVSSVKLDELHNKMQTNLQKDLDNFRRTFHQASSTGHTAATHVGSTQEAVGFHDLQTAENDYRQHLGYRGVPSTGSVHHYTDQQQRETLTDVRQQLPYSYPTAAANTYGTERHRTYQSHETHTSQVHPVPESSHSSLGYVQVPRDSHHTSYHNAHLREHHLDETRQAEVLGTHQSGVLQNQLLAENSQRVYNPHSSHVTYPNRLGETQHYEEHWSSSSHSGGSVAPERTIADHSRHGVGHTERAHYDRDAYNEHQGRYHTSHESRAHTSGSSYDSAAYRANSGQLVTGSLDLGHAGHGADCTEETHQQYQHKSRYHRKYKRDAYHGNAQEHQAIENEDFTQQNQEFGQESQQLKDLTQQTQGSDDFTQQTSGKLELGQQTIDNQHSDNLKQQSEQFTQQTEGQLEFGQQTVDNPHLKDLTQQSEQFTQQTEGQLELGQQTVNNQHLDNLQQQSEQFTQQTEGQLEFGQQTVDNPHLKDLTQQSEQFTQQTEGQLELGQQTVNNQHLDNLQQQSEQFTQQTEGQLEFGQQTVDNPHLKDLTQQSEQFTQQTEGQLELGQQTVNNQHLDNLKQQSEQFTQQTEGQLEFGQQTVNNPHLKDLTQQNEQFTQQTQGLDHLTQQMSGKLEFGQQTVGNQHLSDSTQQSEQFTQQTEGQLEFGQQTVDNPHLEDLTQQTSSKLEYDQQTIDNNQHLEDLMQQSQQFTQQTQGSDDFTQQTSGKIVFGQQADDTQQLEQFTQQTARSDSLTQQTQLGKFEFGQQIDNQHLEDSIQQSEQFAQTMKSDDFTQQSIGKLEFGQQTQSINKPGNPKSQRLEEFNEQSQDFTQQTGGFHDFTQQIGHLEFGQLHQPHRSSKPKDSNHHLEDFTQQNEDLTQQIGGFDDFSQQTAGHLEYGQQREQQQKPNWPKRNTQHLEHYSQQNEWNIDDLSQQSRQYPSYNTNNKQFEWQLEQMSQNKNFERDFTQQTDQDQLTNVKPAPKPKPRPRYQKHGSNPPRTDGTDTIIDDVFKPVEVNPEADIDNFNERIIESGSRATYPESNHHTSTVLYSTQGSSVFDNQRENMDRLHWVHKSNDATVGLQWHYTYHPSDLTNVEGSHDNYYPRHNINSMSQQTEGIQQQSKPIDFNQQETQDKDRLENKHQNSYISQSSQHDEYNQQSGSFQQSETSRFDDQFNQDSDQTASRVIPLQRNERAQLTAEQEQQSTPTTGQTEDKPESRILQAYGGGPYDASRSDDFYIRIRPNPSATLPPMGGDDPWDIREKPRETIILRSTARNTQEIVTTTEVAETTTEVMQTTTPSFWSRVGHKITSTYDKAKEKAKEIFG
ncbi:hypothetical protein ALC62_03113 [Cyphomyrmex costatus]|uniref:Uncharacterized protein n=1 Tax=Cyphomyrmex costatus TaxID=456900 RepID=A0A151IM39_9HYME|nr:hypothetical protein ALC62_03113 [Cyphomyrmex costatus]